MAIANLLHSSENKMIYQKERKFYEANWCIFIQEIQIRIQAIKNKIMELHLYIEFVICTTALEFSISKLLTSQTIILFFL